MNLWEIYATVGLDTTDYTESMNTATSQAEDLADTIGKIGKEEPDMSGFDTATQKSLDDLDKRMASADEDIGNAQKKLDNLDAKGAVVQGVFEGLIDVVGEMVGNAIDSLFAFANESLDKASESGSDAAKEYKQSVSEMEAATAVFSEKTGNFMLGAATIWNEFLETISGVTDLEKLDYMARSLDSYRFERIEALRDSLGDVFGLFEKYEPPSAEDPLGLDDMTGNLESQTAFWKEYAETLESLKAKNIDPAFLAEIADGSVESLSTLKELDKADAQGLEGIQTAFEEAEAAKSAVAESMAATQLEIDETVEQMVNSMANLAAGMDISTEAGENVQETGNAIVSGLAASYPGIAHEVNKIKSKIAELGGFTGGGGFDPLTEQQYTNFATNTDNPMAQNAAGAILDLFRPRATGLDYVPNDDFPARLHAGEAVLTKLEAEDWRRSKTAGGGNTGRVETLLTDLINTVRESAGASIVLDNGVLVGQLTPGINANLGAIARRRG